MVTIREVAAEAGVSVATASNALNNRRNVSDQTREKIQAIASRLGYIPNRAAQAMVHKYTRNICVVLSGPASFKVFTNPIFSDVIRTITSTLTHYDYEVILRVISTDDERDQIAAIDRSGVADGIIYVGTRHTDEELNQIFHNLSIPIVVLIRHAPSPEIYSVSVDNFRCAYLATEHLIKCGHSNIAFVGVLPGASMPDRRLQGYRAALDDAHIAHDPTLEISGDYYQQSGRIAADKIHRMRQERPISAVYAANDLMALGVMEGLDSMGTNVPDDISVVGSDGIQNLHLLKTPLTTVESDFGAIGHRGAEALISILGKRRPTEVHDVIPPALVVRGSTRNRHKATSGNVTNPLN